MLTLGLLTPHDAGQGPLRRDHGDSGQAAPTHASVKEKKIKKKR
jgi:hypothetical protein